MTYPKDITAKAYLDAKGIKYRESGGELVMHCPIGRCDNDSTGYEAHFYMNPGTGQYDCKKCGVQGNLVTLMKHFGDEMEKAARPARSSATNPSFSAKLVEKCHEDLPDFVRQYLKEDRGLTDEVIDAHKIGFGYFYGQPWITFPVKLQSGDYAFFKLRQLPANGNDKITCPKKTEGEEGPGAQLYDWDSLKNAEAPLVICEGELDRLLLLSKGVNAVTSTHGAGTFKKEWAKSLLSQKQIFVCFDNDDAGRKGARKVAALLRESGVEDVSIVTLPEEVGDKGDITDYFLKLGGTVEDLLGKYARPYPEPIDVSKFKELDSDDLTQVLGLTIKRDEQNKLAAFLCQLSAYTEDAQFNISFNAPSSTGKSFIATEVAKLFPDDDVMEIGYCSPTAFFHETGTYTKETNTYDVDLARKIIIFIDMPHQELLARLRPLLSHDKKTIESKITDKNQQGGLRTKTVVIHGYPSVTFCTAGLAVDEQESTRFFLLSPETSQEKIREGIEAAILKGAHGAQYQASLDQDTNRTLLKERIQAIREERIGSIDIAQTDRIEEMLLGRGRKLKPRNQRDAKRLLSLVKAFAVLNVWHRERNGSTVVANEHDVANAIKLWEMISVSQELNLPPYVYDLYRDTILGAWKDKADGILDMAGTVTRSAVGLTRQEILDKHYAIYGRPLDGSKLAKIILPMLETSGLIYQESDPNDKRVKLVYPIVKDSVLDSVPDEAQNNSGDDPGVDTSLPEEDEDPDFTQDVSEVF